MDASWHLGESVYNVDFNLLNESLETPTSKEYESRRKKVAEGYSPARSLSHKMNCFSEVVFEKSLKTSDLCGDCLSDFIKVSHYSQKKYENFNQAYEDTLASLVPTKNGSKSQKQKDEKLAESLILEVRTLQKEYDKLVRIEEKGERQLRQLHLEDQKCDQQIFEALKELNNLQYEFENSYIELESQYTSSIFAEQEVHLLSSSTFTNLFKVEVVNMPPSLSSSALRSHLPILNLSHHTDDSRHVIIAVNGFRVAYSPSPGSALTWGEINAGWSNLCTAVVFLLNDTSHGDMASHENDLDDTSGLMYSYEIVCLRNMSMLVETSRRCRDLSKRQTYSLCYNLDSTLSSTRGFTDEYFKAILALAIVIIEISVFTCRLDIITTFSTLNFLYAQAKVQHAVLDDHSREVDVLAWPSLNQLLSLKEFSMDSKICELANDLLLSCFLIFHPHNTK